MDFCEVRFDEKWINLWLLNADFVILLSSLDLIFPWPLINDVCQADHRKILIFADPFQLIYSRIPMWRDCCLMHVCRNLWVWSHSVLHQIHYFSLNNLKYVSSVMAGECSFMLTLKLTRENSELNKN